MYNDPRNPALEAAIANDPLDREAYLVYADWLEGQGDARAPLIALQCSPDPQQHSGKAVRKLLADDQRYFLGPLSACASAVFWKYGFIHSAGLNDATGPIVTHVENLLAHPSARFITELALTSKYLPELFALLAASPPATLRMLTLASDDEIHLRLLAEVLPQLTTLSLFGPFAFDRLELPVATTANLRTRGISATTGRAITTAVWPRLKTLALGLAGTGAYVEDLAPLFARTDLPALAELEIIGAADADELCGLLVDAPFAPQLRKLALVDCTFTDAGAERIASSPALATLESLSVRNAPITELGEEALRSMNLAALHGVSRRYDDAGE